MNNLTKTLKSINFLFTYIAIIMATNTITIAWLNPYKPSIEILLSVSIIGAAFFLWKFRDLVVMTFDIRFTAYQITISIITFSIISHFGEYVNYTSVDPAGHFDMCRTFANNVSLLTTAPSSTMHYTNYPISYYVNCGILMHLFPSDEFQRQYQSFIIFNCLLSAIIGTGLFSLLSTGSKNNYIIYPVHAAIYFGIIFDLFNSGFMSQILGLAYVLTFLAIRVAFPRKIRQRFSAEVFLIVAVFYAYQYYVLFVFAIDLLDYLSIRKSKPRKLVIIKYIIYKYLLSAVLIAPQFLNYFFAAKSSVNLEGSNFHDLVYSLIPFIFGLIILASTKPESSKGVILKKLVVSLLVIKLLLFIGILTGYVSRYYYFKLMPMEVSIAALASVYILDKRIKESVRNINIKIFFTLVFIFSFYAKSDIVSEKLAAINSLIYTRNLLYVMAPPQVSANDINLLTKLKEYNLKKESTCIASNDAIYLIWSNQITNGIFFRGDHRGNDAWGSSVAWDNMETDAKCMGSYKFKLLTECQNIIDPIYRTQFGCITNKNS